MELEEQVRTYKDRLRIFLILYFFSENYTSPDNPTYRKVFKSEVRIQKIDFLIRNPDYLAYELLVAAKKDIAKRNEIKPIVKGIFQRGEPQFRRLDMERFFFGAYEDIDDVIAFLKSIDFIGFSSKKSTDLKTIEKSYYITDFAMNKVSTALVGLPALKWYVPL